MASAKGLMGYQLMRGLNVPAAGMLVYAFRAIESPAGINSKMLLLIDPVPVIGEQGQKQTADAVPLNRTNMQSLAKAMGDETDDWTDLEVKLGRHKTTNPQSGGDAWGIVILEVKKAKKKREEGPAY